MRPLFLNEANPHAMPAAIFNVLDQFKVARPTEVTRVLDIGCGIGSTAQAIGVAYPLAEVDAIDIDPRAIEVARPAPNVTYKVQDLRTFKPKAPYDVVVCHAVYSELDPAGRVKLMKLIKKALRPEVGAAFVSYNVLPGWGSKVLLREMAIRHSNTDPAQQMSLLQFLTEMNNGRPGWWAAMLKAEFRELRERPSWDLINDFLNPAVQPVWFLDFVRQAADHGLRHVSDANLTAFLPVEYDQNVTEMLQQICGEDGLAWEQYLDFIRNRSFRQSVITHV